MENKKGNTMLDSNWFYFLIGVVSFVGGYPLFGVWAIALGIIGTKSRKEVRKSAAKISERVSKWFKEHNPIYLKQKRDYYASWNARPPPHKRVRK